MAGDPKSSLNAAPWGSIAALLSACIVTLVGVIRGLDPEVILWRAMGAATVLGACAAVASCVISLLHRSS